MIVLCEFINMNIIKERVTLDIFYKIICKYIDIRVFHPICCFNQCIALFTKMYIQCPYRGRLIYVPALTSEKMCTTCINEVATCGSLLYSQQCRHDLNKSTTYGTDAPLIGRKQKKKKYHGRRQGHDNSSRFKSLMHPFFPHSWQNIANVVKVKKSF